MVVRTKTGRQIRTDVMKCDKCSKIIAIEGIQIQEIQAGGYTIRFFSCPHCGRRYHVSTMDQAARETAAEQRKLVRRIKIGLDKHIQKRTVEKHRKRLLKLTDEARTRQKDYLSKIGKLILEGEAPETAEKAVNAAEQMEAQHDQTTGG